MIPGSAFFNSAALLAVPGAALSFQLCGHLMPPWVTGLCTALSLLSLGVRKLGRFRPWLFLYLMTLVYCSWQARSGIESQLKPGLEGQPMLIRGFVSAMPLQFEQGVRYRFWVSTCLAKYCPAGQSLKLAWYSGFGRKSRGASSDSEPQPVLSVGRDTCLKVKLKRPLMPLNYFGFDGELRALEEGTAALGSIRATIECDEFESHRLQLDPAHFVAAGYWSGLQMRVFASVEGVRHRLRERLKRALNQASPDRAAGDASHADQLNRVAKATIVALVVGEQSAIPNAWWTIFNQTGVGHLMSISGLHITLFAGIALWVLKRVFRYPRLAIPLSRLGIQPLKLCWCLAVMAAFGYSLISGWGIPAQRTCWMLASAAWALNTGRSKRMSRVLALAAAVVTLLDPWAPMAAGFWLSFAAVAALVWCGARQTARPEAWHKPALRAQWAATVALAPMGAMFFGTFSVIGPLANAVAIPFVSSLLTPYILAVAVLSMVWSWGASWLLVPAILSTRWMLAALEWMAGFDWAVLVLNRPGWPTLLMASLACVGLLDPFTRRTRNSTRPSLLPRSLYVFGLVPLLVTPGDHPRDDELWLTAFDVGQGAAILLETSGRRLLYDAGPSYGTDSEAGSRIIVPYLRARGIDRIDALVVSHRDNDHAGGAPEVARRLAPHWVSSSITHKRDPELVPDSLYGLRHIACRQGQSWHWGEAHWRFLHPGEQNTTAVRSNSNARSCVLQLKHPAATVLLPGDLEKAQERHLLSQYTADELRSTVLIAPHHGSASSSSRAFLDAVKPDWAIFQVGYRNRFKHPSDQVLQRYESLNSGILRTDRDGAVQIRFSATKPPVVRRLRDESRPYWRLQSTGQGH